MNMNGVLNFCKHLGYRTLFQAKKKAPELCLALAGISGIACVVSACKATVKANEVLKNHNETLANVKEIIAEEPDQFGPKEEKRMVRKVYGNTVLQLGVLYLPAAIYGVAAGASVYGVYKTLTNRNYALAGALAAAERKVQMLQAKEALGLPSGEKEEEDKKEEQEKTYLEKPVPNEAFSFFWGDGDRQWSDWRLRGPMANPIVLNQIEEYFNTILPIRGAIFMNDIFDYFGKKATVPGQFAGWVYDPKKGDHQIDFGVHDPKNREAIAFMNGDEPDGVWIHPNCENYILDKAMAKKHDVWELMRKQRKGLID